MHNLKLLHIGVSASGTPYNGLQKAMMELCEYKELRPGCSHAEVLEITFNWVPNIVFMQIQTPGIVRHETIEYLKGIGSFVINFTGDARKPIPQWYIDMGRYFDISLFSNETDVLTLASKGLKSDFLQLGFDHEIYSPNGKSARGHDVVFMANNYPGEFELSPYREKIARLMYASFDDRFGLYGSGWLRCNGSFMGNQLEEAACYRGSRIAINCSHYDLERYTSDRMFRILGSGVMCLTKWYPGVEKDFKDGEHLVVWNDIPDLINKVEYYLFNEEERKEIAEQGCKLVHGRDTFHHMIENIIKIYRREIR